MVYARPAVLDNPILLAPATENGEIRSQLAEAQGQCVELAVDAGELNAEVEAPRRELAEFLRYDLRFFLIRGVSRPLQLGRHHRHLYQPLDQALMVALHPGAYFQTNVTNGVSCEFLHDSFFNPTEFVRRIAPK